MSSGLDLAQEIAGLVQAKGWGTSVDGCLIRTVEPALDEIHHTWLAGEPSQLKYEVIRRFQPNRIIIPDLSTKGDWRRLESAPGTPQVISRSRMLDKLWNAGAAAEFARRDGEIPDIDFGNHLAFENDPFRRHVDQSLALGARVIKDWQLLEAVVPAEGTKAAILADAGYGKSELLKLLSWGSAVQYMGVASASNEPCLPRLAVRVHLRGMRTFDLNGIASRLRDETSKERKRPGVHIENGHVLRELLVLGRLVLLLDGLDELQISREELERGLRVFEGVVSEGGRIVVSSRAGHFLSATSIRQHFETHEIAEIPPLSLGDAEQLLLNYGASHDECSNILRALGPNSPARGIPLFLLMALSASLKEPLLPFVAESRTRVLLHLISKFCEHDEARIGLPMDEQIRMLTDLADWIAIEGPVDPNDALQLIGLDANDSGAGIVTRPHALLTRREDGRLDGKFPEVQALLAAKSTVDSARTGDWARVVRDWSAVRLDAMTCEYLARLMDDEEVRNAWRTSCAGGSSRFRRLAKRNTLAIALAKLDDLADSDPPSKRSQVLARIIGSRDLSDTQLNGISLERLDLGDWDLRRIDGYGGALRFCESLDKARTDETLLTVELDGCGETVSRERVEADWMLAGIACLDQMLQGWVDKRSPQFRLVSRRSFADAGSVKYWTLLRKHGFALSERKEHGVRYWVLSPGCVGILQDFMRDDDLNRRLELAGGSKDFRTMLIDLGR